MSYGWEGEKVRLVPLDKSKHFENALVWLNDPETTKWLLTGDLPITRLVEEDFFEKAMRPDSTQVTFAIETLAGEHIGFCGLFGIDWKHGTTQSGTIIGPSQFRGRGYGSDALKARTRYTFEVLGLRLLLTEAMSENIASRKALQKAGYREVAQIPKRYWRRGAHRDVTLFILPRKEWHP
jgi:RimJ/RimL family protein N-acetyltransferase